jgi:PleD family two-component response regulator
MGLNELDNLLGEALGEKTQSRGSENRPRVMIVDDNRNVCDALEAVLGDRFSVSSYYDARSALDALNESIHVVLLDIKMEGVDGFQCFEMMRARYSHLPIVFHSAYQDLRDPYELINTLNPFGYLHKGAAESEIVSMLHRAVDYRKKFLDSERKLRQLKQKNEELQQRIREREARIQEQKAVLGYSFKDSAAPRSSKSSFPPGSTVSRGEQARGERLYGIGSIILRLGRELETCRKGKKPLLCCVSEVDSFESIRRREGVSKSEKIVERIAISLSGSLGGQVLVGRLGDARIAFIAPGVGPADVDNVRQEIKERLEVALNSERTEGLLFKITVSSGSVCVATGVGTDSRRLMSLVERALETAKRRGPGSWQSEVLGL